MFGPRLSRIGILVATAVCLPACSMVKSKADVTGEYRLNAHSGAINLQLYDDGRFSEAIVWPSGRTETRLGNWSWNHNVVSLDELWIPREFAPDYIQDADNRNKGQPKYTDSGHWTCHPEKHWGTVRLSIFPDNDEYFEKIK
jgi:hypothetical protein